MGLLTPTSYYSGHEDREPVTTGTTGSGKDAPIHFGTLGPL